MGIRHNSPLLYAVGRGSGVEPVPEFHTPQFPQLSLLPPHGSLPVAGLFVLRVKSSKLTGTMKTIETDVIVTQDGRIRIDLELPTAVPPGRHRAVVVLDEWPASPASRVERSLADFPVHDLGPWPENFSLRRADLYGEDER
jgi:hypothetical protein